MKIFYTASYYGKHKYQQNYDAILKAIEETGVEVVSPEKKNYRDLLSKKRIIKLKNDKQIHYEAIKKGIYWSDAVIIEISNEDFQLGHEATLAIFAKKHVLCLSLHEDFSEKIENKFFHGAKYNEFTLDRIVAEFISLVSKERLDERFNCFLSSRQMDYLESAAAKKGVNKSEYLRMLLNKDKVDNK